MWTSSFAVLITLAFGVNATIHELIVGTFSTKFLYTVEFDDEALTLNLVANTSVPYAANWIAFNHDKTNLYATAYGQSNEAQIPKFVSYALINATSIEHRKTLVTGDNCTATSIFIVADTHPPYHAYGTLFSSTKGLNAGCGAVFSVDEHGVLDAVVQNYTYFPNVSGVHGVALSPDSRYLYSADDTGNTLWTHTVDRITEEVTFLANLTGPTPGSNPRHVVMHPKGHYLYVILEEASQLAQYSIDRETGLPFYDDAYSLLLSAQQNVTDYWADEVALSFSSKYLWASNRAKEANATGYVSVFTLDDWGAIVKQNFLVPTTSSGGLSNILTPSPFTDRFMLLTSNSTGFVEVWELSENAKSAAPVAHLGIQDGGGCCANALWYS